MSYSFNSVRARVKNKSIETGVKVDVLYRRYLLERFIARIAASKHRDSVIIKGGILISAITGIDMRSTKDLDATFRGCGTIRDFENIAMDVIAIELDDQVRFSFVRSEEIILDNNYPCCRIHMRGLLGTMNEKVEIDVTTGDFITPGEIEYGFPTLFGDEKIPIFAYTLETILAEKMTAILDLGVFSTRAKDYYDVYLLTNTQTDKIDRTVLAMALQNTLRRRNKEGLLVNCRDTIFKTVNSIDIQRHWEKYRNEYPYAADIDFRQIVSALLRLLNWAGIEINFTLKEPVDSIPVKKGSILDKMYQIQKTIDAEEVKKEAPGISKTSRLRERDV